MLFFLLFQDANLLKCLPLSYSQAEYDDKDMKYETKVIPNKVCIIDFTQLNMKYELATLNVHNNSCQMLGCSAPMS